MKTMELTRAWTEPEYRATLTEDELIEIPDSPAGVLLDEFEVADPERPGVYNSGILCWLSLYSTSVCCAW